MMVGLQVKISAHPMSVVLSLDEAIELRDWLNKTLPASMFSKPATKTK